MPDIRTLLKKEQLARRISHQYASYSSTGTLLCTACHLQIKDESLWDRHLQSVGHMLHANKSEEISRETTPVTKASPEIYVNEKKRKASCEDDNSNDNEIRKRSKPVNGVHLESSSNSKIESPKFNSLNETSIPSRPATPMKLASSVPAVDEDEWAAFEADIAAAEIFNPLSETNISAPAMSAEDIKKKSVEEEYVYKKERQEAEIEGDKEDAARKMEEELENMENLEARLKRLQAKREELRQKQSFQRLSELPTPGMIVSPISMNEKEQDEDEDEDEDEDFDDFDEWDTFRARP
ncbi:hypothetical protein K3495_g4508 [Podosphaera aphanis]|nr:hypothetical protein K3495_g4508 [Podosphaera aphanis]